MRSDQIAGFLCEKKKKKKRRLVDGTRHHPIIFYEVRLHDGSHESLIQP